MTITTLTSDSTISAIRVGGRLDTVSSAELDEALRPFEEWTSHLIVDLTACNYLSSTGIRVLIRTDKRLKSKGGSLYLAGLSPAVFQVLEMAGLHQAFSVFDSFKQGEATVRHNLSMKCPCQFWQIGEQSWKLQPFISTNDPFLCWKDAGMVGYNELGFAIGVGQAADSLDEKPGLFLTTGHSAGFLVSEPTETYDLRIVSQPEQAAVLVKGALSFGTRPSGWLVQEKEETVTLREMIATIHQKCQEGFHSFVAACFDASNPSITCGVMLDQLQFDRLQEDCGCFTGNIEMPELGITVWGARFDLNTLEKPVDPVALIEFLKNALTYSNILNVRRLRLDFQIKDVQAWIFKSTELVDALTRRMSIQAPDCFYEDPNTVFLTRRLYPEVSRLDIALFRESETCKLFDVTSYDAEGRKLRPTLLKLADRNTIIREEEHFLEQVQPFISNNNAQVQGTALYNNAGALCYSLSGLGNGLKEAKELNNLIEEGKMDVLDPLFDTIFLQLLEPWYSQPVEKAIHPFRDNNPYLTGLQRFVEAACEACGVSVDSPALVLEETGQRIVNPYWFLKHEYPARIDTSLLYYVSICHGNLNAHTVLLDRFMNVFLIDFSETGPRSVVTDFAHMEAFLLVERAPMKTKQDLKTMIDLATSYYHADAFSMRAIPDYGKLDKTAMETNLGLIQKLRTIAQRYTKGTTTLMPYYMALLERLLPLACDPKLSAQHKRLSMVVSGLLCEKVTNLLNEA